MARRKIIIVQESTHRLLKQRGAKGETFDEIIMRLLKDKKK